ncbi:MAG: 6-carboxytetrahydropterin synthase QueD [Candidatus Omnitrophica bacterium]|nr:6-carboxytetrahydropterin synthase QueD [Candidatus Omnitrophota bacterium]
MFELSIVDHFSAAHFIRGYEGPCRNMHGHTWKVSVTVQSEDVNDIGLVLDFKEMKENLKTILYEFDHVCLNDLPQFKDVNPTSENLAKFIYQEFSKSCDSCKIVKVQVWESDTASVVYSE